MPKSTAEKREFLKQLEREGNLIQLPKQTKELSIEEKRDFLKKLESQRDDRLTRILQENVPSESEYKPVNPFMLPANVGSSLVRAGQEAIGGDPLEALKKPFTEPGRNIPLDVITSLTQGTGSPLENQEEASLGEKIAGIGSSVALDPLTYIGTKALTKAPEMIAGVEKGLAGAYGALGDIMTGGVVTKKGMQEALKFSPKEQLFRYSTLEKQGSKYGPMKEALEDLLFAGGTDLTVPQFKLVPLTDKFDKSIYTLERSIAKQGRYGESLEKAKILLDRLKEMKSKGEAGAPELADILDQLNNLERTPLDNKRAIADVIKDGFVKVRDETTRLLKESSPEFAKERSTYASAAEMAMGRAGGHLTEMYRKGFERQAILSLRSGNPSQISNTLTFLAAQHPEVLHAVMVAGRIPVSIAKFGAEKVAKFISKNPKTAEAMFQTLLLGLKEKGALEDLDLSQNQEVVENPAPDTQLSLGEPPVPQEIPQQMPQTPQSPPVSPLDARIMQETGLQSVVNGKIKDPVEKAEFLRKIEVNPNLTEEQKMKIRYRLNFDGTVTLPENL